MQYFSLFFCVSTVPDAIATCYLQEYLLHTYSSYAFVAVSQFGVSFLGKGVASEGGELCSFENWKKAIYEDGPFLFFVYVELVGQGQL